MNIDGFALPIKKLKGTEPVETLDLSFKELGPNSAIMIASLIGANSSLTSVRWPSAHEPKPCLHSALASSMGLALANYQLLHTALVCSSM